MLWEEKKIFVNLRIIKQFLTNKNLIFICKNLPKSYRFITSCVSCVYKYSYQRWNSLIWFLNSRIWNIWNSWIFVCHLFSLPNILAFLRSRLQGEILEGLLKYVGQFNEINWFQLYFIILDIENCTGDGSYVFIDFFICLNQLLSSSSEKKYRHFPFLLT